MIHDIFADLNAYLGGPYALTLIVCIIAFFLAYILIFYMAKSDDFGVLLIFTGIFMMLANPIGVDKSELTFFIGVFILVLGIYLGIKRRDV